MAAINNAYSTGDATANREDLHNIISNIDPTETPFMSRLTGEVDVTNIEFSWQVENLKAVDADNRVEEGHEVTRDPGQPTQRASNVCQISDKNATVTGTQEAANAAGKRSEMAHQMAMRSAELKRDMETMLTSDAPIIRDTEPRQTRGFGNWIQTNVSMGANGALPASETENFTAGTARPLTEDLVEDTMQTCWDNGARPSRIMTNGYNRRQFSKFSGRGDTQRNVDKKRVVATVTIFESDFGDLTVVPNRFMPANRVDLIDPDYVKMAFYRRFKTTPLAKIGDADTKMIVVEYGLKVVNEAAHGSIRDLTTSPQ